MLSVENEFDGDIGIAEDINYCNCGNQIEKNTIVILKNLELLFFARYL